MKKNAPQRKSKIAASTVCCARWLGVCMSRANGIYAGRQQLNTQNVFVFNGWLFRFIFHSYLFSMPSLPAYHCMHLSLLLLTNIAPANIYHSVWECHFIYWNGKRTDCISVVSERIPQHRERVGRDEIHQKYKQKKNENIWSEERKSLSVCNEESENCTELLTSLKWCLIARKKNNNDISFSFGFWRSQRKTLFIYFIIYTNKRNEKSAHHFGIIQYKKMVQIRVISLATQKCIFANNKFTHTHARKSISFSDHSIINYNVRAPYIFIQFGKKVYDSFLVYIQHCLFKGFKCNKMLCLINWMVHSLTLYGVWMADRNTRTHIHMHEHERRALTLY